MTTLNKSQLNNTNINNYNNKNSNLLSCYKLSSNFKPRKKNNTKNNNNNNNINSKMIIASRFSRSLILDLGYLSMGLACNTTSPSQQSSSEQQMSNFDGGGYIYNDNNNNNNNYNDHNNNVFQSTTRMPLGVGSLVDSNVGVHTHLASCSNKDWSLNSIGSITNINNNIINTRPSYKFPSTLSIRDFQNGSDAQSISSRIISNNSRNSDSYSNTSISMSVNDDVHSSSSSSSYSRLLKKGNKQSYASRNLKTGQFICPPSSATILSSRIQASLSSASPLLLPSSLLPLPHSSLSSPPSSSLLLLKNEANDDYQGTTTVKGTTSRALYDRGELLDGSSIRLFDKGEIMDGSSIRKSPTNNRIIDDSVGKPSNKSSVMRSKPSRNIPLTPGLHSLVSVWYPEVQFDNERSCNKIEKHLESSNKGDYYSNGLSSIIENNTTPNTTTLMPPTIKPYFSTTTMATTNTITSNNNGNTNDDDDDDSRVERLDTTIINAEDTQGRLNREGSSNNHKNCGNTKWWNSVGQFFRNIKSKLKRKRRKQRDVQENIESQKSVKKQSSRKMSKNQSSCWGGLRNLIMRLSKKKEPFSIDSSIPSEGREESIKEVRLSQEDKVPFKSFTTAPEVIPVSVLLK